MLWQEKKKKQQQHIKGDKNRKKKQKSCLKTIINSGYRGTHMDTWNQLLLAKIAYSTVKPIKTRPNTHANRQNRVTNFYGYWLLCKRFHSFFIILV